MLDILMTLAMFRCLAEEKTCLFAIFMKVMLTTGEALKEEFTPKWKLAETANTHSQAIQDVILFVHHFWRNVAL